MCRSSHFISFIMQKKQVLVTCYVSKYRLRLNNICHWTTVEPMEILHTSLSFIVVQWNLSKLDSLYWDTLYTNKACGPKSIYSYRNIPVKPKSPLIYIICLFLKGCSLEGFTISFKCIDLSLPGGSWTSKGRGKQTRRGRRRTEKETLA